MHRTAKSLTFALYATLAFYAIVFVTVHIAGTFYNEQKAENERHKLSAGLTKDTARLMLAGDTIATHDSIISALNENNRTKLLAELKRELAVYPIGLMGVADKYGVVLARTLSPSKYGDNVFLTAPAGRVVSTGKPVSSIEMSGFANQLFMTTARPVKNGGTMIGALFANYLLDNQYAAYFQETYMSPSTKVVFYTKNYGVYGNGFAGTPQEKIIESYFTTGSEWIASGLSGKTVFFDDGSSYIVENVIFPGLETSPGGALLFIPRADTTTKASIIIASITLLFFICLAIRIHRKHREIRGPKYYRTLIIFSIPVFVLVFITFSLQNTNRTILRHVPYTLYNSTMHLQPNSGIYNIGSEQSFDISVETGDEAINAVQARLTFDPKAVTVKEISTTGSVCTYVIEDSIDPIAGTIDFSCAIIGDKGGQETARIATIITAPRTVGSFDLRFDDSHSKVLANDGLATNVLRTTENGSYRVGDFDLTGVDKNKRAFMVYSPTHPNQGRWYSNPTASFTWIGKTDAVYRYAFDTNPTTQPTNAETVTGNKATIDIPGDGIFYFHLQLTDGGPIAHYRIQADQTPPTISALRASQTEIMAGDVVRFNFNAIDTGSGVQKNYYIDLGNHLFLPAGAQLYIPFVESGNQKITLRVYDGAGNYSEKSEVISVLPKRR